MPGCIEKSLHKFQHFSPLLKHNIPRKWRRPQYGAIIQYVSDCDTTSELGKDEKTKVQNIVGTLLHYARDVDFTILVALNNISEQQSKPTELTVEAITHLFYYAETHPDAYIRYK